ncbi:hypothetical protein JI735_30755 [Paenibacillus sonchi]|uniref:Uncharacterized protein n=1 Tax=Paenibacillus sonchi TaxID=373687 RepID=A0A974PBG0_9BACL|nr:hypothetical protein [Paenibacillus sonchi]QQZ60785.1 hypothetical protein JI735_30755 [Paenibacillus sonchi]
MNFILWESFIDCLENPEGTKNYINYYSVLTLWLRNNKHYFSEDLFKKNRLDILTNLNPNIYVIEDPGFPITSELQRFERNKPKNLEVFAMILGNRLWDMVTIRGKACPNCEGDEMRYLLAEELAKKNKKIILECNSCGWIENIDGTSWEGSDKVVILPASKNEIEKLLIS